MKKNAQKKQSNYVLTEEDRERIAELTGGDTDQIREALDQWEREREALAELSDENQALTIYMGRVKILITSYKQIVKQLSEELSLFASQKTRDRITEFWKEVNDMESIVKSAEKTKGRK